MQARNEDRQAKQKAIEEASSRKAGLDFRAGDRRLRTVDANLDHGRFFGYSFET